MTRDHAENGSRVAGTLTFVLSFELVLIAGQRRLMGLSRASEVGAGDGAVDMSGDGPPGGADIGGGRDRLVVGGEGIQDLVVDPAVDQGEGEPVGVSR